MSTKPPIEPSRRMDAWPLSIIAFFSVAICGCVAFIIFCNMNKSDLVAADYYEQEIRYQSQMESANRGRALEAANEAAILYMPRERVIRVSVPVEHAKDARGIVRLYCPSDVRLDVVKPLAFAADATQDIEVAGLKPGPWQLKISWRYSEKEYHMDRRVLIGSNSIPSSTNVTIIR